MGGCGRQKVSPRSADSTLVSMTAPAGPDFSGWLLQICKKRVHLARGLQHQHTTHVKCYDTQILCNLMMLCYGGTRIAQNFEGK